MHTELPNEYVYSIYVAESWAEDIAEKRPKMCEEEAAAVREKFVKRQEYDSFLLKQMAQKREIDERSERVHLIFSLKVWTTISNGQRQMVKHFQFYS